MKYVFENLKLLKKDMEAKGWVIDAFNFEYKQRNYIILVTLFDLKENKPEYALVKLDFLASDNFDKNLSTCANSVRLFCAAKELRAFFVIDYSDNFGDMIKQFYLHLSKFIPAQVSSKKTNEQKKAINILLSKSDSEDPNKIYCYKVRRNPITSDGTLGQRSSYNDNKTRVLRENLYKHLGNEKNLSFCYSVNDQDEKSDEEIVSNWINNK